MSYVVNNKWKESMYGYTLGQWEKASQIYGKLDTSKESRIIYRSWFGRLGVSKAKEMNAVFTLSVKDMPYHLGNPYSIDKRLGIKVDTVKDAVIAYTAYILFSQEARAIRIRQWLANGVLKGKPLVYYKDIGEPSHAHALEYLINHYDEISFQVPVTGKIGYLTDESMLGVINDIAQLDFVKFKNTKRRVAHIGKDYSYSGITVKGTDWSICPSIQMLMERLNVKLGTNFNSCLINDYAKNVPVGIGRHTDTEPCLVNNGVCSVSIGIDSDCEFIFRPVRKNEIAKQFTLKHGDIFYWTAEDNKNYTHEIPNTVFPNGRLSITFREII